LHTDVQDCDFFSLNCVHSVVILVFRYCSTWYLKWFVVGLYCKVLHLFWAWTFNCIS